MSIPAQIGKITQIYYGPNDWTSHHWKPINIAIPPYFCPIATIFNTLTLPLWRRLHTEKDDELIS
jgi:hypothetical protein